MFNIVLVEPEIPQNTGNIARTCASTGSRLHLIRPLGFEITEKHVKRAGLDYWDSVEIFYYDSIYELMEQNKDKQFYFASSKASKNHTQVKFNDGDFLVFGKETKGLDEKLLHENYDKCIRIPMVKGNRCLNLSNAVAVVLYEALRQSDFVGLENEGKLTKF